MDLLRERRGLCMELHRETDPMARKMLEADIQRVDREIAKLMPNDSLNRR